jgi:hypothetical protein
MASTGPERKAMRKHVHKSRKMAAAASGSNAGSHKLGDPTRSNTSSSHPNSTGVPWSLLDTLRRLSADVEIIRTSPADPALLAPLADMALHEYHIAKRFHCAELIAALKVPDGPTNPSTSQECVRLYHELEGSLTWLRQVGGVGCVDAVLSRTHTHDCPSPVAIYQFTVA